MDEFDLNLKEMFEHVIKIAEDFRTNIQGKIQ